MLKKLIPFALVALHVGLAYGGSGGRERFTAPQPLPPETPVDANATFKPVPPPDWSTMNNAVGTFTTLTGFYDYQSNGGSVQHIQVNPANGNIHVTYMLATDSTAAGLNLSRRVAYAFSSDGGVSWNNFSNVTVPNRRSGFPTIDLLQGANAGLPVIASHPDGTPTIATLFVDSPEGTGLFSELTPPPALGQTLEPIWPHVGSASDGSMIVAASQNNQTVTTGVGWHNRMQNDFATWNPTWDMWPGDVQSGGRYPVRANGTGRVGILWNTSNGTAVAGNRLRESTDNGVTWSAPVNLFPPRVVGADTMYPYVHCDFVYNGDVPLYVFSEFNINSTGTDLQPDIVFYSAATGFVVAVPYDSTKYYFDPVNQRFHRDNLGWPSIGLSGSTIVVAYQGFQQESDARNYRYSDIWMVTSNDGGNTWSAPERITDTPNQDERYPSVSKWNAPGVANMVWSQKSQSGLYAFPGGADTVRSFQVFLRKTLTSVGEGETGVASSFKLSQNFPNPFNPGTKIDYTVSKSGPVSIKVYNMLGQEVATLLDQDLSPGQYQVTFDGSALASGVYMYRMQAGSFVESKKMILLK
ncbi:MAG: T9SS type A sorting domain-containing protein [Ignavibacteriae bacterium]|nr:T9SS type A sorting domain-containing protein [Ignavibacteriota bacterium]